MRPIRSPDGQREHGQLVGGGLGDEQPPAVRLTATATGDSPPPSGRSTDSILSNTIRLVSITATWPSLAMAT